MATIGVDFDHTLVEGDTAIAGAKDAINCLRERGHKIIIYSCNGIKWIEKVLNNNDIRYDAIWDREKPVLDLYVDDRGYHFKGDWKLALPEILEAIDVNDAAAKARKKQAGLRDSEGVSGRSQE